MSGKPHILVLMPDTRRGDCLSCGGHPVVQTPNVDHLAGEGVRFSRAYTTSPVCMPARSSFHTGLFCHNHGQWKNYGHCPTDVENYAALLRRSGYHTCHVGKSHLYGHKRDDHLDHHKPFMNALGWDDVLEVTGPYATRHTDSIMTDHWRRIGCLDTFRNDYARRVEAGPRAVPWPSPMPPGETMDDFVGGTAVQYIRDYQRQEPMLLFVGFGGPHDPFDPPAEWAARYNPADMPPPLRGNTPPPWATPAAAEHQRILEADTDWVTPEVSGAIRSHYYAKVSHIDWWVGRIMQALQDRGMGQDTSVVFWSDHGDMLCDKGRIHKSVFYQGSADVPLIIRPAPRCRHAGPGSRRVRVAGLAGGLHADDRRVGGMRPAKGRSWSVARAVAGESGGEHPRRGVQRDRPADHDPYGPLQDGRGQRRPDAQVCMTCGRIRRSH